MTKEQKIERSDALSITLEVNEQLIRENLIRDVFIGGSLKRGLDFVADVDIGIIPTGVYEGGHAWWAETMKEIFNLLHMPEGTPEGFKQVCGKEILRLARYGVQVDIWAAEKYYWGPMCMFIAGNAKLNMLQRVKAKKQGILLSNKGLFTLDGKDLGKFETEQKVYDFLGWEWLGYTERNIH